MDNEMNNVVQNEAQENEQPNEQPQNMYSPPVYQPKPIFELKKDDTAFAFCILVASIFTAVWGIFGGFALGYLVSSVLMTLLLFIYFIKKGKLSVLPITFGALSLANASVFICTTNDTVRLFGVIVSFLLSLVCYDGLKNGSQKSNRQTLQVFYSAVSTVGNVDITLKSLFSGSDGNKKSIGKVLVGLLCAIPVLLVVIPLLISSDYAFSGMMSELFSNSFTFIMKSILGVVLSIFVISYCFSLDFGRVSKPKQGDFKGIENVYVISFLSAIGVCYMLYLFSQLAYFFSAFKGFLPDTEITYAEYARKGFFEMCFIALINLVIVFAALLIAKKQNGKVCYVIRALATFIAVFTLIIISTAISKMVLYISAYGMTVLRLTTSAFMLFLGVVFISVILRIYVTKINIIKTALLAAGLIVLVLGTVNVNAVCARYNYDSYYSGRLKSIDIEAIYELGDEGIPYIVRLAESNDTEISNQAKKYLAKAYINDYFENMPSTKGFEADDLKNNQKDNSFEHFSIPKSAAYDVLYDYIEKNPDFGLEAYKLLKPYHKSFL